MNTEKYLEDVVGVVAKRNITISFAESCTGGRVSANLAKKSGISKIFAGSVVSYSNAMKSQVLGVPKNQIRCHGAVSRVVALSMAKGVKNISGSTWAVSITGIAGPTGGTKEKPVGTVCFGVVGPGISDTYQKLFSGDREEVQAKAEEFVWEILMKHLAIDLKEE